MRIEQQIKIARIFFILSALYGLSLRLFKHVDFIPFHYKNILEGHSHIAFLGWGFLAVISLIAQKYFPEKLKNSQKLKWFFNTMVFSLFGLLISFPLQGYRFFSILFLSIFLITSYLYLYAILRELKSLRSNSTRFIKTGILFYYLSSIAIWSVGIVVSKFGKTDLYYNIIYFYLHFLYNGFFVFTLLGLFFEYLSSKKHSEKINITPHFYYLTTVSCILGYSLSLLWSEHHYIIQAIAILSALIQLTSLLYFLPIARSAFSIKPETQVKQLLAIVFSAFVLKIFLQFLSVFPELFQHVLLFKSNFIIGYIHLFTLGFLSPMIFILFSTNLNIELNKLGLRFYVFGFITSEIILFGQGISLSHFGFTLPYYDACLLISSSLIFIGLIILYFRNKKREE